MLLLSGILSLGFIATNMVGYFVARASLASQISNDTLPLIGDNIYSEIQRDLLQPIIIASLMANDTFLKDWVTRGEKNPKEIQKYLKTIQNTYNTVTSFFISDKSLNYYHPSGILKKVSPTLASDQWYFHARNLKTTHELNIDYDPSKNDELTVFINYKVMDANNDVLGITGVGLALSQVQNLIELYQQKYNREVFFIDLKGEVTLFGSAYQGDIDFSHDINGINIKDKILNNGSASVSYPKGSQNIMVDSRFIEEFNWYLIIRQSDKDLDGSIFDSLLLNLFISLMITIIVLSLTWLTLGGYQKKLEEMAITDKLTGLNNRQMFDPILDQMFQLATRDGSELSVLILDIDDFKKVNDQYGHPFGDQVLVEVAKLLKESTRDSDVLCRWGGEEFLLLMPDASSVEALKFTQHLQSRFANLNLVIEKTNIKVEFSIGIASKCATDEPSHFIYRADQALLQAKQNGKNQIVVG